MALSTFGYGGGNPASFGYGTGTSAPTVPPTDTMASVRAGVFVRAGMDVSEGNAYRFGNYSRAKDENGNASQAFEALQPDGVTWTPMDPDSVILTVLRPDGTQLRYGWPADSTDGPLVRESSGRFYVDVPVSHGVWRQVIRGLGSITAADETLIYIRPLHGGA